MEKEQEAKAHGRRSALERLGFILVAILVLWLLVGFLAITPVTGNHRYWRIFRAQPADFGLQAESVSFQSLDGIPLGAWYIPAQGAARGTVIISHGINGNRSDMLPRAAFLVRAGYNTLLVDLRDHGDSGGNYAGPGYIESRDVLGAVSYLRKCGDRDAIIAMGHSYGAVASIYAAAQSREISAVIADSAYISFEDMVKRATILLSNDPERSFWERLGLRLASFRVAEWAVMPSFYLRTGVWLNRREANSLVIIPLVGERPILFIAGGRDKICPAGNARIMYNAALSPNKGLLIIPNAEHDTTYTTDPQLYQSTVVKFLEKALAATGNLRLG